MSVPDRSADQPAAQSGPKPSTLRIGRRYRPNRLEGEYDAIVIGSGIGGLTSAACLARTGRKVLVLEQHYTAGGFTHSYSRNGYEWDVGVHYIGDVGSRKSLSRRLYDFVTDGQLQWAPMDANFDRFFIGEERFDVLAGKQAYRDSLRARFPDEEAAIDAYLERLDKASDAVGILGLEKLLPGGPAALFKLARKAILPDYLNRTTYEVLSDLTDNELLKAVITGQWGDSGVPPRESSFVIHSLIAKHYQRGAWYPVGGASRIAETIIPVIQRSGGEVFTYAPVEEILVRRNRARGVRMRDGTEITAPVVISNAGVFNTFGQLLPQPISERHGYRKRLGKVSPSIGHLGLYIGHPGFRRGPGPAENQFLDLPRRKARGESRRVCRRQQGPLSGRVYFLSLRQGPELGAALPGHRHDRNCRARLLRNLREVAECPLGTARRGTTSN